VFYFNPTVAAGAFLLDSANRALWIRRAHEPRQGTLAIPGGFIDFGETLEDGLRREIREEVGLDVGELRMVASGVNEYPYRGVIYSVVDCVFAGRIRPGMEPQALDGVAGLEWHPLDAVRDEEIAFPSVRLGRAALLQNPL
jgi:ADP-ribose pyrophosphatase YjhB (NUDIX family)